MCLRRWFGRRQPRTAIRTRDLRPHPTLTGLLPEANPSLPAPSKATSLPAGIRVRAVFTGAKYARSGSINIAYQVVGDGPLDLVFVPGWISNLAYMWELPSLAAVLNRLAAFSRLILFDKRGTGLSDRVLDLPALDQRMDDVRAVLDAVGSQCAAVMGVSEGGVMSALFAATYPERTAALVMVGSYPSWRQRPGYPWGRTDEQTNRLQ